MTVITADSNNAEKNSVLVIDDDTMLLRVAEIMLGEIFSVSVARSGAQAMALLSEFVPDIILLDVNMPDMDGYEVLERIGDIEEAEDVPVIFLTGRSGSEEELKGLHSGAADYITKPFVKEVLIARIKLRLESGRQRRQLSSLMKNIKDNGWNIDRDKMDSMLVCLTDTEKKVARLVALGYGNREIAQELNYSYEYVKKVTKVIFGKMQVGSRSELRRLFTA